MAFTELHLRWMAEKYPQRFPGQIKPVFSSLPPVRAVTSSTVEPKLSRSTSYQLGGMLVPMRGAGPCPGQSWGLGQVTQGASRVVTVDFRQQLAVPCTACDMDLDRPSTPPASQDTTLPPHRTFWFARQFTGGANTFRGWFGDGFFRGSLVAKVNGWRLEACRTWSVNLSTLLKNNYSLELVYIWE